MFCVVISLCGDENKHTKKCTNVKPDESLSGVNVFESCFPKQNAIGIGF